MTKRTRLTEEVIRREFARLMGAKTIKDAAEVKAGMYYCIDAPVMRMQFMCRGFGIIIEFKKRDLYRRLDTFSPRFLEPSAVVLARKSGRLGH